LLGEEFSDGLDVELRVGHGIPLEDQGSPEVIAPAAFDRSVFEARSMGTGGRRLC
jgi:hypothetical protein